MGQALEVIADRRVTRAGHANINNHAGYRRAVLASLRTELADQIAIAPTVATLDELVRWLDPPTATERHAAAQAAIRGRNDAPLCAGCDGNRFVETPKGAVPCSDCQAA